MPISFVACCSYPGASAVTCRVSLIPTERCGAPRSDAVAKVATRITHAQPCKQCAVQKFNIRNCHEKISDFALTLRCAGRRSWLDRGVGAYRTAYPTRVLPCVGSLSAVASCCAGTVNRTVRRPVAPSGGRAYRYGAEARSERTALYM